MKFAMCLETAVGPKWVHARQMGVDHAVGVLRDVRTQDLGGDARVVHDRDGLADVVAQRGHHNLVGRPRLLGPGGRLKRVLETVALLPPPARSCPIR